MHYIKKHIGGLTFVFFAIISLMGCQSTPSKNEVVTTAVDLDKLILIKDTLAGAYHLSIYAQDSLHDQNETLYALLRDTTGKALEDIPVDYSMHMDMGKMSHGGPYYPIVNLGHGLYKAEVVFIMPNMQEMGKGWIFQGLINKKDSISLALPVSQAPSMRTSAVETKADGRIFVSLVAPEKVTSGSHPVQFTLHKIGHHDFPALDGYSIAVEPFMPDMGHGSSGNSPAEGQGDGRYQGTINLSMPGLWHLKVKLFKNGEEAVKEELVFKLQATPNE